jgi:hypothetical protein
MSLSKLCSSLQSVEVPDSLLTRQITEFVRDSETELLPCTRPGIFADICCTFV